MLSCLSPATDMWAVPRPAGPVAPSSSGAVQLTSLRPVSLVEMVEVLETGSWWNRKWSPVMVTGSEALLTWASMVDIGVEEDQPVTVPKVVVKLSGTPMMCAAWRWVPSKPA